MYSEDFTKMINPLQITCCIPLFTVSRLTDNMHLLLVFCHFKVCLGSLEAKSFKSIYCYFKRYDKICGFIEFMYCKAISYVRRRKHGSVNKRETKNENDSNWFVYCWKLVIYWDEIESEFNCTAATFVFP